MWKKVSGEWLMLKTSQLGFLGFKCLYKYSIRVFGQYIENELEEF